MKFLLIVLVVGVLLWLLFGRRRGPPPDSGAKKNGAKGDAAPQAMIACAHCGVHLPRGDALPGADDRWFCSEAHRIAGPR
jgi:uncharacterized protein